MALVTGFDHVGIRVTDIARAQAFYESLGFVADPEEESPDAAARGLVHPSGIRIHLIYNGIADDAVGNVLMDTQPKRPGYTHVAFLVEDMDAFVAWLRKMKIAITEGPVVMGSGRRRGCFVRDPDRNVLEFNELLA
ncbi:VOC family protein [Pelagerythrobacter marensis]|uniref:Glyoxalase n=1 Tax=Pelagerythrobacter marensis TaxID=543877 RepID=A0A0G3XB75_9SPHN|nr:VOC family protein [Pelagerythrobacter marensis]AKM07891.1 glyoxalase [Pelagerythrobacter marensis]